MKRMRVEPTIGRQEPSRGATAPTLPPASGGSRRTTASRKSITRLFYKIEVVPFRSARAPQRLHQLGGRNGFAEVDAEDVDVGAAECCGAFPVELPRLPFGSAAVAAPVIAVVLPLFHPARPVFEDGSARAARRGGVCSAEKINLVADFG